LQPGVEAAPLPYPQGWYAVGFDSELSPGRVQVRRFMGRDIVLFRTGSGRPYAAEAHCPDMGAHLGHGGTVVGENLRCPFQVARTVRLHIAIWAHKRYVDRPALAAGDGPIGFYRKWTQQFYPAPNGRP
jgi:hypothetical protein